VSATIAATDLAAARERNERTWAETSRLFYEKRFEESMALWAPDARIEVAYPVEGIPPVVEGREALVALFSGFGVGVERLWASDLRFHQTDDPDVAIVEYGLHATLIGGATYDTRIISRITFRGGLVADVTEYYDHAAQVQLFRDLGFAA